MDNNSYMSYHTLDGNERENLASRRMKNIKLITAVIIALIILFILYYIINLYTNTLNPVFFVGGFIVFAVYLIYK